MIPLTNEATLNLITTSMLHSTIPVYNKTAVFTVKPVECGLEHYGM